MDAIVTIPPYADYIDEIAEHPIVSGLRLNTVMPIMGPLEDKLRDLKDKAGGKDLWVDLKCRQLRTVGYSQPPFTTIALAHNFSVDTPVKAYFNDGKECATVARVDGNELIMLDGPKRLIGPGESINIPHPSLKIEGYFTQTDKEYIEAMKKTGLRNIMLSFVEGCADIKQLQDIYPKANIVAKIESQRGMNYVQEKWKGHPRLMAARGDMYVELARPHLVVGALQDIITKDDSAIVASRIFPSLENSYMPSAQDIGDVDSLMRLGYHSFMFGDDICFKRDSILSGLNLLQEMAREYTRRSA